MPARSGAARRGRCRSNHDGRSGRVLGRSVMTAPGPLRGLRLKAVERGEEVFQRLTVIAILLAPSWVAGIHRAGTAVFLITNTLSAAVWAVGIGLVGSLGGAQGGPRSTGVHSGDRRVHALAQTHREYSHFWPYRQ